MCKRFLLLLLFPVILSRCVISRPKRRGQVVALARMSSSFPIPTSTKRRVAPTTRTTNEFVESGALRLDS